MNLKPISELKPPIPFQVLDIETMNWTKFIVLGFYDGKNYLEFRSLKKFLDFIKTQKSLNIFAHFGGKFDLLFILQAIFKDKDFKLNTLIPRGSSILTIEVIYENCKHSFRDSAALMPFGLKSLSENFAVDTIKGDWDHTKTRGYSKGLSKYLQADCKSLYQCIEKFYEWPLIQKSGPAYTSASQAMKVFRTFLKEEISNLPTNATDFCRESYLGGRTEIFKPFYNGKGPLYEYDCNSLYPFVMANGVYPIDVGYKTFSRDKSKLGIYEASVSIDADFYLPSLGVIRDGKYIFPTGNFKGHWTSAELDYAESLGYKIKIHRGHEFKTKKYLFKDYVDALYSIRESSPKNSVSNVLAKLLMNSLYGRFGMNLERENITLDLKEGNKEYLVLKIGGRNVQIFTEPTTLNSFTHTAIASFVTSYARIHMHKTMFKISDSIYYTDTDSIFTTSELSTGARLGDFKLEHVYDSACFLLPKTYIATSKSKTKIAMKGFDKKKIQNFTFEDFKHAFEGDLKRLKVTNEPKFASLKSALAQKKLVTMTKANEKQLRTKYSKRIILKNGDTKPIQLKEF